MKIVYQITEDDVLSILDDLDTRLDAGELEEACGQVESAFQELEEREYEAGRERKIAEDVLVAFLELLESRRRWDRRRIA